MASAHTATPTFRIEPSLKEAVRTAAVNGHQSIANMIAAMIRNYCGPVGIAIADLAAPLVGSKPSAKTKKNK